MSRREVYDDIRAESDRLYRLVENLLAPSRVEREGLAIEREPIRLQRLLPRVVSAEAMRWPASKFELDIKSGLPPVAAEETYVEQVVRNLLTNAAKYGGGTIFVRAELASDSREGSAFATTGPASARTRKTGCSRSSIGRPRRRGGRRVGIWPSVSRLVRAMGGQIWAANRSEGGAEFTFELPGFADL